MRGFKRITTIATLLLIVSIAALSILPLADAASGTLITPDSLQVTGRTVSPLSLNVYDVDVTAEDTAIQPGDHTNLRVVVTWAANGSTVDNVYVQFSSSPSTATFTPALTRTSVVPSKGEWIGGIASSDFTSSTAGTYQITVQAYSAYYGKGDSRNKVDATGALTITVGTPAPSPSPSPSPSPGVETPTPAAEVTATPLVTVIPAATSSPTFDLSALQGPVCCLSGILLLLLVLGVVFLFLWLKKSLKVLPAKTKIPADGTSVTPVRVQFVNGLGMARKPGKETEILLESTAGQIKSVTLPAGKHSVDAALVPSKEFGPVTITARAGGKTATARVEFVAEKGVIEILAQPETVPADGKSSAALTVGVKDEKGNYVAPLEDRTVDLKTTMGTLSSPLKWPARATSVSTNLVSGEAGGVAVITATMGALRGEGKVTFQGMPKRFCMHCGTPMSLEASQCPKCGKTPPSGTDVKQCPACSTVIPDAAKFCHHCGALQP